MEDLNDWKTALENALSQAPSASHAMGQNGIFNNEQSDQADATKGGQGMLLLFWAIVYYVNENKVIYFALDMKTAES